MNDRTGAINGNGWRSRNLAFPTENVAGISNLLKITIGLV